MGKVLKVFKDQLDLQVILDLKGLKVSQVQKVVLVLRVSKVYKEKME